MTDTCRVWRFYDGHRVRMLGGLFRVNRYGDVEYRLKSKPLRWKRMVKDGTIAQRVRRRIIADTNEIPVKWR